MKLLAAIILLVLTNKYGLANELTGIVKDMSGNSLSGVLVYSYPKSIPKPEELSPYQYTNTKGEFRFRHPGMVLFFIHKDFVPTVKTLAEGITHVEVSLSDAKESEWPLSSCSNLIGSEKYIGEKVKVRVPTNLALQIEKGTDSKSIAIKHELGRNVSWFLIWISVSAGSFPDNDLVLSSSSISSRLLRSKNDYGREFRGQLSDGKCWRYVNFGFYDFIYKDASPEAAAIFDKIIDSLCVE